MISWHAVCSCILYGSPNDTMQSILNPMVIGNLWLISHENSFTLNDYGKLAEIVKISTKLQNLVKIVGGFCCQVPPEPRLTVLIRKDFSSKKTTALSSGPHLSIVVICNYYFWSGNGGTPPGKN